METWVCAHFEYRTAEVAVQAWMERIARLKKTPNMDAKAWVHAVREAEEKLAEAEQDLDEIGNRLAEQFRELLAK